MEVDVIIIGSGPAGIQAAIYTQRANLKTLVIGKDCGALCKADKVENYYGFAQPITGKALIQAGIEQAINLGVDVISAEVTKIAYDGSYVVKTVDQEYRAITVLLATGASRSIPKIQGIKEFEGRGISYCAVCDGFFYKHKPVALLGSGNYAAQESEELVNIVSSLTVFTDGLPISGNFPKGVIFNTKKIKEVTGELSISTIVLEDGEKVKIKGLFVALNSASSVDFATKLGAATHKNKIVVDDKQATNLPGLFAAGDCTEGVYQIARAVGDGCVAGLEMIHTVRLAKSTR